MFTLFIIHHNCKDNDIIFHDDFSNANKLNDSNWFVCRQNDQAYPNNEIYYRSKNVLVENNTLTLLVKSDINDFTSAQISPKQLFKFGNLKIRLRVPQHRYPGVVTEIILLNTNNHGHIYGRIDLLYDDNGSHKFNQGLHYWVGNEFRFNGLEVNKTADFGNNFHDFELSWSPGAISFYMNGHSVGRYKLCQQFLADNYNRESEPFSQPFRLIIRTNSIIKNHQVNYQWIIQKINMMNLYYNNNMMILLSSIIDEFDGKYLDKNKWEIWVGNYNHLGLFSGQTSVFNESDKNIQLFYGKLALTAVEMSANDYTSALIVSKDYLSSDIIETRLAIPDAVGHPTMKCVTQNLNMANLANFNIHTIIYETQYYRFMFNKEETKKLDQLTKCKYQLGIGLIVDEDIHSIDQNEHGTNMKLSRNINRFTITNNTNKCNWFLNISHYLEERVMPTTHNYLNETITHSIIDNVMDGWHPWIVVVLKNNKHHCTGSIIDANWVITAAHCFNNNKNIQLFRIRAGSVTRLDGNDYQVSEVVTHPRFDACGHKSSDIALIKIVGTIDMGPTVRPIVLPTTMMDEPKPSNNYLIVAGWGKTAFNMSNTVDLKKQFRLSIIPSHVCANAYNRVDGVVHWIFRSQLCTWNHQQTVCEGYSGGPAIQYIDNEPVLIGTVSYGVQCSDGYPVVFSKISYFIDWINKTMNESTLSDNIQNKLTINIEKTDDHICNNCEKIVNPNYRQGNLTITQAVKKEVKEGVHPWLVVILKNGRQHCTGSIVNKHWIVSAACCFVEATPKNYTIRSGSLSRLDGNEYHIVKVVAHNQFNYTGDKQSDIALLKINGQIDMGADTQSIEFPSIEFEEPRSELLITAGWGRVSYNSNLTLELAAEYWLTRISMIECANKYGEIGVTGHRLYNSQFCSWNFNQNICLGNSGGPAIEYRQGKPVLIGLVSYGVKCLDTYPIVFTKISCYLIKFIL
ncbi:uncharacterized protein LOC128951291 [Oppia nitens]|uniref:uncharacterized protein LOC128951291 n=1 Tax=Oppia nitens TaxID=1686743 RepID=UPI0023DB1BC3|nr:uncharacterized protein LOC128951291 [Oppia nitens]